MNILSFTFPTAQKHKDHKVYVNIVCRHSGPPDIRIGIRKKRSAQQRVVFNMGLAPGEDIIIRFSNRSQT